MVRDRQLTGHHHLAVLPCRQQGLEQQRMSRTMQLDQSGDLRLPPRVVDHIDQHRPSPPGQRRSQQPDRLLRSWRLERDPRRGDLPLELRHVDRHPGQVEAIGPAHRHQSSSTELAAQVADMGLQAVGRLRRRVTLPHRLQEAARLQRPTLVQHQADQHVPSPGAADHDLPAPDRHRQGAQQPDRQRLVGAHATWHRPDGGQTLPSSSVPSRDADPTTITLRAFDGRARRPDAPTWFGYRSGLLRCGR